MLGKVRAQGVDAVRLLRCSLKAPLQQDDALQLGVDVGIVT